VLIQASREENPSHRFDGEVSIDPASTLIMKIISPPKNAYVPIVSHACFLMAASIASALAPFTTSTFSPFLK
jgi:hypothetical protein